MALGALDTNGYVELLRGGPRTAAIRAAIGAAGTNLVVLMPVVAELLQGARSLAEERSIVQRFVAVVPAVRRIAATPEVWAATGSRVAAMLRAGTTRRNCSDVRSISTCMSRCSAVRSASP